VAGQAGGLEIGGLELADGARERRVPPGLAAKEREVEVLERERRGEDRGDARGADGLLAEREGDPREREHLGGGGERGDEARADEQACVARDRQLAAPHVRHGFGAHEHVALGERAGSGERGEAGEGEHAEDRIGSRRGARLGRKPCVLGRAERPVPLGATGCVFSLVQAHLDGRGAPPCYAPLVRIRAIALASTLAVVAPTSCAEATAIDVEVTSELDCTDGAQVMLVGASTLAELAGRAPSAAATRCEADGSVFRRGHVVVLPSGPERRAAFAVVTRRGGADPSDCLAGGADCIVAKRQIAFVDRKTLRVRVDLRRACLGVPCGVDETCDDGVCVAASACADGFCSDGGVPVPEAGADVDVDAGSRAIVDIAAGMQHACAVLDDGSVWCWGANTAGQLGDGTVLRRSTAAAVPLPWRAKSVAAGEEHTCALLDTGAVVCWGANSAGQLGDGTTASRAAPAQVVGIMDARAVAAGARHNCALVAGGQVRCWGANVRGQLGNGLDSTVQSTPTGVLGLVDATAIAAGGSHSCALIDHALSCWGEGSFGMLGNDQTNDSSVPVSAQAVVKLDGVALGDAHSCARDVNGRGWCWGANGSGQLGDGTLVNRLIPTATQLDGVAQLAAGGAFTCAALTTGTVRCVGDNAVGQLGNGTTVAQSVPSTVLGLSGVSRIAAGGRFACAIVGTREAWCWGSNSAGQLGSGSAQAASTVPVRVVGLP
jgi:alpha-tubulin suppressor-like RCC1 family protein